MNGDGNGGELVITRGGEGIQALRRREGKTERRTRAELDQKHEDGEMNAQK